MHTSSLRVFFYQEILRERQQTKIIERYPVGSPERLRAGTWLAGGYSAVLFALTGDLDYFSAMLDLPNWSLVSGPCVYCKATATGANTWTDFRDIAPWRATCWSANEWRSWEGRSRCPLLSLPGTSCWSICYDWMHSKYLGMDMYLFGSVLAILVQMILPDSEQENLQAVWQFLKEHFRVNRTKSPFRYLNRLTMFIRRGKFPKLRGKAAEVRHFGKALSALWMSKMNPLLELHRKISLMLRLNVQLEDMLTEYAEEFSLPAGPASDFEQACRSMLLLQNEIANHFIDEGLQYFDVTTKSHFVQHLSILSCHVNPRLIWAFRGEDQMKKLQTLAQSCTKGNTQAQTNLKMGRHYRLGLHLRFYDKEKL